MSKGNVLSDLNSLAKILQQEKICSDIRPINEVVGKLGKSDKLSYNLQKLIFNIVDVPRNTVPSDIKSLSIVLSVEISENHNDEDQVINPIIDNYNFSIEISGFSKGEKVISNWHLDFDSDEGNEYLHPDFHLTFGGNIMKDINLGQVLLLPSPRLAHPPMDAILGVDFIIRNFIKKEKSRKLTNNPLYRKAIRNSQKRLWKPYMLATAGHWCNYNGCRFNGNVDLGKKYYPTLEGIH